MNRFQKMWHITLPGIRPTIIVLLIMNLGWVLNASFEVPYILGGGLLQDVSQTLDIFVLKYGMSIGNYSLATAAGIFKSVISLILVFATNAVANKLGENSLMWEGKLMNNTSGLKRKRISLENIIFNSINGLIMIFSIVVMLYPFWNTVAVSFNDAQDTLDRKSVV